MAGAAIGTVGVAGKRRDASRVFQQVRERQRVFLVRAAAAIAAHGDREFAAGEDRDALALRAGLKRQPGVIGGNIAGLAFEVGAEIDRLVTGLK
jgi:hypothetical protein